MCIVNRQFVAWHLKLNAGLNLNLSEFAEVIFMWDDVLRPLDPVIVDTRV
jgi:hypothetical protein